MMPSLRGSEIGLNVLTVLLLSDELTDKNSLST